MVAMAREGKLSLDDPLAKYEPSYTDASQITIAQLLAHESGIRDYYPLDYPTLESFHPITMQALADRYGHLPLDFAPGTRWQYSNSGYTIAGVIAQRVEGATLFDVYRRRFFAPLGMTSAHWIDGGFSPTDAVGYTSYFFGPFDVAPVAAAAMAQRRRKSFDDGARSGALDDRAHGAQRRPGARHGGICGRRDCSPTREPRVRSRILTRCVQRSLSSQPMAAKSWATNPPRSSFRTTTRRLSSSPT